MTVHHGLLASLISLCALFNMAGPASAANTSEHLLQVPAPFDARILSVGNELLHNGQRVSLATFESPSPLNETALFYRELWSQEPADDRPGMIEERAGGWLIIARLQDGFQTVLQLDEEFPARSKGLLSVMQMGSGVGTAPSSSLLPGMQRLSSTRSQDDGRASVLSVHRATEAVEPLARQLADLWQGKGWNLVSSELYQQSRVLLLNRKDARMEVVISDVPGQGTLVVVNEVDDHD